MTQEDKKLLLKDLCARLPYGIKVQYIDKYGHSHIGKLVSINIDYVEEVIIHWEDDYTFEEDVAYLLLEEVKPFLRPMSSQTSKEKEELNNILEYQYYSDDSCMCESTDWLNENMFDFRGLIPKGHALNTEEYNPYKD